MEREEKQPVSHPDHVYVRVGGSVVVVDIPMTQETMGRLARATKSGNPELPTGQIKVISSRNPR